MKNKILLIVVILLIPFVVISFFDKKTNFILPEKKVISNYVILNEKKIPLEEYLICVVAAEMPALFLEEALKAQAVVSRTFASYQMKNLGYVTTGDQAYITKEEMQEKWQNLYDEYYQKITKAVNDTNNKMIYYNNNLIKAYYSAMSNGKTEDALSVFNEQLPYIVSIKSNDDNPKQIVSTKISRDKIKKLLNVSELNIGNIEYRDNNYVDYILINNEKITGVNFRKLLNLRSASFTIKEYPEEIEFITNGYGHAVGMSQYGANNMAKNGKSYVDIIKYYYQNVEIK